MTRARESGPRTRDALIEAGIDIFGRDGYHAASSRALADAAGVNQALIGYHFGSKEGLYLAVFERVAERIGAQVTELATEVAAAIEEIEHAAGDRRETCLRYIEKLLGRHVRLMVRPEMQRLSQLVLREQLEPSKAFEIVYRGTTGRLVDMLSLLVAMAEGRDAADEEDRLRALMLLGQSLMFRAARAVVLCAMDWREGIGEKETRQIERMIGAHVRAILGRDHG